MEKPPILGLILDVDGTILDSMPDQFNWLEYCATELFNKEFPYKKLDAKFKDDYNNAHDREGLEGIYQLFGVSYNQNQDLLWNHYSKWKADHEIPIVEGMTEAIKEIYEISRPGKGKSRGMRIVLNTTNKWGSFGPILEKNGMMSYIDASITREELPENETAILIKPHVYSIELSLEQLGTAYDETLHVGDTCSDIIACRNLKLRNIDRSQEIEVAAVTWGFESAEKLKKANPTYLLKKPEELVELVKKRGNF